MVEFLAQSFCLDVLTRQPDYVAYGKFVGSWTSIGVLLLCSGNLFPALLNSSPEFNYLVGPRFGIGDVQDGPVSRYSLDGGLYARVKPLLSIKWCNAH